MTTAARTAGTISADQRVAAGQRVDEGDRDDRQGQDVGQEPLVEVGGEADDERDEPRSEHDEGQPDREPNRIGSSPSARAPTNAHDDRPPVDRRPGGCSLVVLRPARREAVGGDAEDEPAAPRTPESDPSVSRRAGFGRRAEVPRLAGGQPPRRRRARARRAWRGTTPVAPARRERQRLAEVGGARDVEVDPRLGHELAQEQPALDERALGRAGVLEVAVPAVHVGDVVVDERQLPVALAGPCRRPP